MPLGDALPSPEIYFDPPGNCYYVKNTRGTYIQMRESSLKVKLKDEGFSHEIEGDEPLSEVDGVMNSVRHDKDVDYAGPLAGYPSGVFEIQTRRVLVTEGPRLIEPDNVPWPTIRALLGRGVAALGVLFVAQDCDFVTARGSSPAWAGARDCRAASVRKEPCAEHDYEATRGP
jgi:hypothetical protein